MIGDVRIASVGLKATQAELVHWADAADVTVTATDLLTQHEYDPVTATVAGGVATGLLPIAVTTDLAQVQLLWQSDGETITTHLDVRGSRLPVQELPNTNPSSQINDPGRPSWKVERALSDALQDFEDACKGVPMSPRRVEVTPTV